MGIIVMKMMAVWCYKECGMKPDDDIYQSPLQTISQLPSPNQFLINYKILLLLDKERKTA